MSFPKALTILLLFMLVTLCDCQSSNDISIDDYILQRYQEVKNKVLDGIKNYSQQFKAKNVKISITYDYLKSILSQSKIVSFKLMNSTYFLLNNHGYKFSFEQNNFIFTPEFVLSEIKSEILFVEIVEYQNNILALIVSKNGYLIVYQVKHNNWKFIQIIVNPSYAREVVHFVQNNHLYLFIINYGKKFIPSTLYIWTGVNFVETSSIKTIAAQSVAHFKYKNSQIITIIQTPKDQALVGTYVLDITNGKIKKQNFLDSNPSVKVLTYRMESENYLLLIDLNNGGTIFRWDGEYFLKWKQFIIPSSYQKFVVYYTRNKPLLYAAKQNSLDIYDLQGKDITMVKSIPFQKYYWRIQNINFMTFGSEIFIYVIGNIDLTYTEIILFSISIDVDEQSNQFKDETLLDCYLNLNEKLKIRNQLLNRLRNKSQKILQLNKNVKINGVVYTPFDVVFNKSYVQNTYSSKYFQKSYKPILNKFNRLKGKIRFLSKNIKINGPVTIAGKLEVGNFKISSASLKSINGNLWNPMLWLSKSKIQTVNVPLFAPVIRTISLSITNPKNILNGLLHNNESPVFQGDFEFKSLTVRNITVNKINKIPVEKLVRKGVFIKPKGEKYFQNISAVNINTKIINMVNATTMLNTMKHFIRYNFNNLRTLNIRHLNFEKLNGLQWNTFLKSVFNLRNNHRLDGNIDLFANAKINNLITIKLAHQDTDNFFTTSTDQEVSTNFRIQNINVKNLISSDINGLSLRHQAATFQETRVIGPVTIKNIHVTGDVNCVNFPIEKFKDTVLLHTYKGLVKIKGSLTVYNVRMNPSTELYHRNKVLLHNLLQKYWLKSQYQIISIPITAYNGLSVKELNTTYINEAGFVLYSTSFEKKNIDYKFKSIQIDGDCKVFDKNVKIIKKILTESVRKTGRFQILGHKLFLKQLRIDQLFTNDLDNTKIVDLVKINDVVTFKGNQKFQKLKIKDQINITNMNKVLIQEINKIRIVDLLYNAVSIDKNATINNLILKSIDTQTSHLNFANANGQNVKEMFTKTMRVLGMETIRKVKISGDLKVPILFDTKVVNNIEISDYLSQVVSVKDSAKVQGVKEFKNKVFVTNNVIDIVNNLDFKNIAQIYLLIKKNQEIPAHFTFEHLQADHLSTPFLNDLETKLFLDVKQKKNLTITSNLHFSTLECNALHSTKFFNLNLIEILHSLNILPGYTWSNVTVLKDIQFSRVGGNFRILIAKSVNKLKPNIVTEKVNFEYMHAQKVILLKSKINNVNIKELYDDALKNVETTQNVTGKNTFMKLTVTAMKVGRNANIRQVNDIDIINLNRSIVDRTLLYQMSIRGKKQFMSNVEIKKLQIPSTIHKIHPKNLITLQNTAETLPNITFKNLNIIKDLDTSFIKNINVTHILINTVKCKSIVPQYIYSDIVFKNVEFSGNISAAYINNIDLKNVVVDHDTQIIQNMKQFENVVFINGDFNAKQLNGNKLSEIFKNAILTGSDIVINNNLMFKKAVSVFSDIECKKINGIETSRIVTSVEQGILKITNITIEALDKLKDIFDAYSSLLDEPEDNIN